MTATASPSLMPAYLRLLFVIFFFSGFAGLIYESIWTHYLKLFLGHAAYAQTLVLSIFMLGMAIGSWLAGRVSLRSRRFFVIYAVVELILGVCALLFHPISIGLNQFFFDTLVHSIDSQQGIQLAKWSLATLLIMPQSILIGMTFPLIANGLMELQRDHSGKMVSLLYFTNSIGASVGVLASGFVLIGWLGLHGTITLSGCVNLLIGLSVLLLFSKIKGQLPAAPSQVNPTIKADKQSKLLLLVACFTGLASFIYEIIWIRLLSLVLGSATHAFELMLSSFILGLALGGLLIRNKVDKFDNPVRVLAIIQIAMGMAAVSSLLFYDKAFDLMLYAKGMLTQTEAGYLGFNLTSHLICLLMMLPTTILAGMTLPIIIHVLVKKAGDQSVGNAYALNTLGAIAGILLTVHILLPILGTKNSLLVGAMIDISLGLLLIGERQNYRSKIQFFAVASITAALFALMFMIPLNLHKLSSGLFRYNFIPYASDVRFYRDGKTASISVLEHPGNMRTLATNGKPDASAGPPYGQLADDESSQILMGAIPALLAPNKEQVAVIGFGSGMSVHAVLALDEVKRVETIEIEPAVVEAARLFAHKSQRAFTDPRNHVIYEDAKTWFAGTQRQYGLIVAEPSNPWVSGVSSLFTTEFYQQIQRYLTKDGVFAQWIQVYELSPELFASIGNALGDNFPYYDVYQVGHNDLLLLASRQPLPQARDLTESTTQMRQQLAPFGIHHPQEIAALKVINKEKLAPVLEAISPLRNSDYYPIVDQHAVKSRYMGHVAIGLLKYLNSDLPLAGTVLEPAFYNISEPIRHAKHTTALFDTQLYYASLMKNQDVAIAMPGFQAVTLTIPDCPEANLPLFWQFFPEVFKKLSAHLSPEQLQQLWQQKLQHHACLKRPEREAEWLLFDGIAMRNYQQLQAATENLLPQQNMLPPSLVENDYLQRLWLLASIQLADTQQPMPFKPQQLLHSDQNKDWINHLLLQHYFALKKAAN